MNDPRSWRPPLDASCISGHHLGISWFADRDPGTDSGRSAVAVCATCPLAAACTTASVARNEHHGIWGGAGGLRRRALRRSWGTPEWDDALAAHLRRLHREPAEAGDAALLLAHGPESECGKRGHHAKGCRGDACALAAAVEGALGRSLTSAAAEWAGAAA